MKNSNELIIVDKNDILSIINESVRSEVKREHEKLLSYLGTNYPQERIISLDRFAELMECSLPTARKIAIKLDIKPRIYDSNSKALFIMSEIIQKVKTADSPNWFKRERDKLINKLPELTIEENNQA